MTTPVSPTPAPPSASPAASTRVARVLTLIGGGLVVLGLLAGVTSGGLLALSAGRWSPTAALLPEDTTALRVDLDGVSLSVSKTPGAQPTAALTAASTFWLWEQPIDLSVDIADKAVTLSARDARPRIAGYAILEIELGDLPIDEDDIIVQAQDDRTAVWGGRGPWSWMEHEDGGAPWPIVERIRDEVGEDIRERLGDFRPTGWSELRDFRPAWLGD